jgi:hypothetical protein
MTQRHAAALALVGKAAKILREATDNVGKLLATVRVS